MTGPIEPLTNRLRFRPAPAGASVGHHAITAGTIGGWVSINVNFGAAGVAHFRDQFAVRSLTSGTFSAGGDSGSFVWQWNRRLSPVGLLFAGGGGTTFCNRMSRVLAALQVSPL